MSSIKVFATISILAGIVVLLDGTLIHVGIILIIEGGVLFTLVKKSTSQDSRSQDLSS